MKTLKEYDVVFSSLKLGVHEYDFHIGDAFFEHFGYDDITEPKLDVKLELAKRSAHLEFNLSHKGSIEVVCDISGEPFRRDIEGELSLIVKFGDDYNYDNEEVVIIPHGDYQFNISQYIYEMIVLSLPVKNVHPGIEDGSLESDMVNRLEEFSNEEEEKNNDIDPRWSKLKDLLTDK